jgi:hypothetical protein
MPQRKLFSPALLAFAALAAFSPEGAEPAPGERAAGAVPCPEWATATLALRNLGGSFERLSQYCDLAAANSGALVRLTATSWLFPIPLEGGLDPNGPALVFLLDPDAPGRAFDKALVLPVAEAAGVREALKNAFGVAEQDGLMKVLIPQGFNEPDKTMLIRVTERAVLAAPGEFLLKELAQFVDPKGVAAGLAPNGPDAIAVMNLRAWQRLRARRLETILGWAVGAASLAWPSAAEQFRAFSASALEKAGELDRLELRASLSGGNLKLDAFVHALPNTALAAGWQRPLPQPADTWLPWLTDQTALFVTGAVPSKSLPGDQQFRELLLRLVPPRQESETAAREKLSQAWGAVLAGLDGQAAYSMVSRPDGGFYPSLLLSSRDGASARDAFRELLKLAAEAWGERLAASGAALKSDADPRLAVKVVTSGPTKVGAESAEVLIRDGLLAEPVRQLVAICCGWPPKVYLRATSAGLWLGWGNEHPQLLTWSEPEAATRAAKAEAPRDLPPDAAGWALLRPATALRGWLPFMARLGPETVARLLDQLPDAPVRASWGGSEGRIYARLEVPAEALRTGLECYLRLLREGFDPLGNLGAKPGVRDVTVPPPAP